MLCRAYKRAFALAAALLVFLPVLCGCSLRRADDTPSPMQPRETPTAPSGVTADEGVADAQESEGTPALDAAATDGDTAAQTAGATTDTAERGAGREAQTTESPAETRAAVEAPRGEYEPLVFMYHLILDEPYSPYENLFVRPSEFRSHVEALIELGYRFEFAEDYREVFEYPTAIITLDDGYEDNYTEMLPILREYGAKATVFVATSLVGTPGYLTEAQVKEMSDSGLVSIQSHTVAHADLSYMSADLIEREMSDSIAYLEGLTGRKVRSMAYPAGSYNDTVRAAVGKYVDFAYTTEPPSMRKTDGPLAIPRIRINRGLPKDAFLWMIGY